MKSEKEFSKILKKITTQFAGYYDDMKALLEKLYAKAKTLGLTVKESIHDVYSRVGISTDKVSIKQKVDNFFESLLSDD